MRNIVWFWVVCILGLFTGCMSEVVAQIPNEHCALCHAQPAERQVSPRGRRFVRVIDYQIFAESVHKGLRCVDCHDDVNSLPHSEKLQQVNCQFCHNLRSRRGVPRTIRYLEYQNSVHGRARAAGNLKAPTCQTCHGSHNVFLPQDPRSSDYKGNIARTCGQCHTEIMEIYTRSVHGQALAKGNWSAPVCTNCHGEHRIQPHQLVSSTVYGPTITKTTCPACHSVERIAPRFRVAYEKMTPYVDSYHGAASRAGLIEVANCASCHGIHDILSSKDPASSINPANIPQTCGKCHPNAGINFAKGTVHLLVTPREVGYVRKIYLVLIFVIIGGMVLHNSLVMLRHLRQRLRESRKAPVVRFTTTEIGQHLAIMIIFILLALSGFALHFPDAWWCRWITENEGGFRLRSNIHRIAAVGLVLVGLWNFIYMLFNRRGRSQWKMLLPGLVDLRQLFQNIAYQAGLRSERPRFDRFSYIEKVEYWAVVWGTYLMIITGFPMWFENFFLGFLPRVLLDVFRAIHYYEAWLASLAIIVWHLYYVIFDIDSYPMNWAWLTGRVSREYLEHHHPAEGVGHFK